MPLRAAKPHPFLLLCYYFFYHRIESLTILLALALSELTTSVLEALIKLEMTAPNSGT